MKPTVLTLALAAALAGLDARAQSAADATVDKQMGTVLVTGTRPTSLPTQIPTTIEGVTAAEMARTINAFDAEDALKYLPSLLVRKRYIGDYNHAVLSTRASGTGNSARSAVYADGILLSNYLGNGATFAPRWGMVTPSEIERVDVLYGPFSAAYGGNAVGAVVDYVTRMPRRFEAHAKLALAHQRQRLYGTRAGYDGRQGSVSLGNRHGAWSWFIDLSRNDSEGQPQTFVTRLRGAGMAPAGVVAGGAVPGQDRAYRDWLILGTGTQYHTVQDHLKAKLAYDVSPTLRATYVFGLWQNRAEGRPHSYLREGAGEPVYSGAVTVDGRGYQLGPTDFALSNERLRHAMHGLTLKRATKGVFDWEVAASRYEYEQDTLRAAGLPLPGALAGGPGRIVDGAGTGWHTFAAKGVWRPQGGAHVVEAGYQRASYKLASSEHATSDWLQGEPGARNAAFGGRTRIDAWYVQDSWRFAPDWKTVLGLRAERWQAMDGRTANARIIVAHPERRARHYSPKAALSWQARPDWVLKASLGRAVRMPTVSELYQGGIGSTGVLVNNDPDLAPERSWTGELSAERDFAGASLRLTAFGERTRDALYSQTNVLVTPNVTNVQNVGRIDTKGMELAFAGTDLLRPGLDFNASLTWTDSIIERNDKFPASVGKRQPRIPEWRATAVASYRASDRLSFTLAGRYSGNQYTTLDNSDPNGFAYQGSSRYFTADLRATWRLDAHWSVALGVDNLNNYQYWNFHPYPQRTWIAELRFDL